VDCIVRGRGDVREHRTVMKWVRWKAIGGSLIAFISDHGVLQPKQYNRLTLRNVLYVLIVSVWKTGPPEWYHNICNRFSTYCPLCIYMYVYTYIHTYINCFASFSKNKTYKQKESVFKVDVSTPNQSIFL